MATITTDTYLDGGTARTAGETWTVNAGAKLTIRTDTRFHANAPASATGSLGSITINAGEVLIDGRNVRWLPYDTGTGNVPAIGTSIIQGAVSGYLLGVWASLNTAPTAAASAMPATGFIKLREVTGGSYTSGALTGIGASATGPDVTGWIEVVGDDAIAVTVSRLGKFNVQGDWFYLDNTNGSAGQVIQLPNSGGAATWYPGIWIETAVSSGVYEFYPAISNVSVTTAFSATNFGTDDRSKFVQTIGTGQIRIGNNGSVNVGYTPPSGCKIRIPNVLLNSCATASRASNSVPNATIGTRPEFATTNAGVIEIVNAIGDWYFNFSQAYSLKFYNCATFDSIVASEIASALDWNDCHTGIYANLDAVNVAITSCFAGGTVTNCKFGRAGTVASGDNSMTITTSNNITFSGCFFQSRALRTHATLGYSLVMSQCSGITLTNCVTCPAISVVTCVNTTITNLTYLDRYIGTTGTTYPTYCVLVTALSNGFTLDGLSFWPGVSNVHPYSGLVSLANSSNIKIRNIGSIATPLNMGSANASGVVVNHGGNNNTIKVQRVYVQNTRTGLYASLNSDKNVMYEHVWGDYADPVGSANLNHIDKGGRQGSGTPTTSFTSVYGTHFWDAHTSDTAGRIGLFFNEPTTETSPYITRSIGATPSGYSSTGLLALTRVGEYVIYEWPHFVLGYTSFSSSTAVVKTGVNTGNLTYEFDIDTGSGFANTWTALTASNLNAKVITNTTGFKLRIRITCATANTGNTLTGVYCALVTDTTSRQVTYPLDTNTLTLTGLVAGSDIVILDAGTTTERVNVDANAGTTYPFVYNTTGNIDVCVYKKGYIPFAIRDYALGTSDASLLIAQIADRNYVD